MDLTVRKEIYGGDDQRWLGSAHGTSNAQSITLDKSLFTAGTHYPNGYFPSGTALGLVTATGKYGPYTTGASNGTQTFVGHLLTPVPTTTGGNDLVAALFNHGRVVQAALPIPGVIDAAAKTAVAGRIWYV